MVDGLSRIQCIPVKSKPITAIVVYTIMSIVIVAAISAVLALIIIRNRHALGPPGRPLAPQPRACCETEHVLGCRSLLCLPAAAAGPGLPLGWVELCDPVPAGAARAASRHTLSSSMHPAQAELN